MQTTRSAHGLAGQRHVAAGETAAPILATVLTNT